MDIVQIRYHRRSPKTRKKGLLLAEWLNRDAGTDTGKKVLAFMAGVHELHDLQRDERRPRAKFNSDPHGWKRAEKLMKAQELSEKLGREWQGIAAPLSFVSLAYDGSYIEEFTHTRLYDDREGVPPPLVGDALRWLITENLLGRVRQCLWCKRWIFAVKQSQKCCSTKCRSGFHHSDPQYKIDHAKKMKQLRRDEKKKRAAQDAANWRAELLRVKVKK